MKNIPIFTTEYGTASLILREIPYKKEAYVANPSALPGRLRELALAFCLARRFPMMWVMVGILVVKESFMAIMGLLILRHNGCKLNGAKWFGKVSTAFLYVAVFLLLVVPGMKDALANGLILVSCGLLLLSLGGYIPEYRRLWKLPQNEA